MTLLQRRRSSRSCPLFRFQQVRREPITVYGCLCKSFGNDGRLTEFESESQMDQRVEDTWIRSVHQQT